MFYERKIKYLDYIENGERVKNVGFIKIEVRDDDCNIDMQIKGVPIRDSIAREILLNGGGKTSSLGEVTMLNGEGNFTLHKGEASALGNKGMAYSELENIQINVDQSRVIRCVWAQRNVEKATVLKQEISTKPMQAAEQEKTVVDEMAAIKQKITVIDEKATIEQKKVAIDENIAKEQVKKATDEYSDVEQSRSKRERELRFPWLRGRDKTCDEVVDVPENDVMNAPTEAMVNDPTTQINVRIAKTKEKSNTNPKKEETTTFREDKWSQIASIYSHICPFEDEREYLMVQPRDFVMLGSRSYPLVNNSFLLHGYYNYNHLVLAKKMGRGEDIYYIGVPGNFYDREKQVAIMFGFESFECKEEPAGQGDYGYYMIRVDM